jgi:hypothetical protein
MSTENSQSAASSHAGRSVCRHLRSKGQFITGLVDPATESGEVGDGHCWCSLTSHALGPDDNFAERASCVAGRSCFVAML